MSIKPPFPCHSFNGAKPRRFKSQWVAKSQGEKEEKRNFEQLLSQLWMLLLLLYPPPSRFQEKICPYWTLFGRRVLKNGVELSGSTSAPLLYSWIVFTIWKSRLDIIKKNWPRPKSRNLCPKQKTKKCFSSTMVDILFMFSFGVAHFDPFFFDCWAVFKR